jgi:hypothetical protein
MKYTELLEISMPYADITSSSFNNFDDITRYLKQYGFKKLKTGSNAIIFSHPKKKYVIKIFGNTDEAYYRFYEFCLRHQDNPHLPKFVGKMVSKNNFSIVRIERLKPNSIDPKERHKICQTFHTMFYNKVSNKNDKLYHIDSPYVKMLYPTMELILNDMDLTRLHSDFGGSDLMMRGQTLVIIDPVSN